MKPIEHLLIYAFQPFGAYTTNITKQLLYHLPAYANVTTAVLPVHFDPTPWQQLIQHLQPSHVLGLGQCPRGHHIRIEQRAFNQMQDLTIGLQQAIEADGPATLSTTWKLPVMSGFRPSYDAGRYVCNFGMWHMIRHSQQHKIPYAFLHIPRPLGLNRARQDIQALVSRLEWMT